MGEAAQFRHEPVFNRLFAFDRVRYDQPVAADAFGQAEILLYSQFVQITRRFGFDEFLVANLPSAGEFRFDEQVVLTSFSPTIIAEFDRLAALQHWSVFEPLRRSNVPFAFVAHRNTEDGNASAEELDCLNAIEAYSGCCIPVVRIGGERAFVMLTSATRDKTASLAEIALDVARLFERLVSSKTQQLLPASGAGLNTREVECLKWAAAGKTSSEIALITTLSEHTINHYLNICCRKLDAVNRVQAVAKAIRLSII